MRRLFRYLLTSVFCLIVVQSIAQSSTAAYAVQVEAEPVAGGMELSWKVDTTASAIIIWRKTPSATTWGTSVANLTGASTTWTDPNFNPTESYEYKIEKTVPGKKAYGYVLAGEMTPATHSFGKVLVVLDTTFEAQLTTELAQLNEDLVGAGWQPEWLRIDRNDAVDTVKNRIKAIYAQNGNALGAIFLLGHVPVPYSGNLNPDGHTDHKGAWPADTYYGEMDAQWGDFSVNTTSASRTQNHNIPFDGKWDMTTLPSDVDVPVGRVDFARMSFFSESEADLLRRYLTKDHAFRHKLFSVPESAVIEDNFGVIPYPPPNTPEYFAASGWRNFAPLAGRANTADGDFRTSLLNNDYLWAYGCGGGSYTSASGIITTPQFATDSLRAVFTLLFGSYFGDFDADNNLMRAALASKGHILTCAWAGRPQMQFHRMGLGEPIGESILRTQNNALLYDRGYFTRSVHIALMGDPTLRQHALAPPQSLAVAIVNSDRDAQLTWTASPDSVAGYYVYRAEQFEGPYVQVSNLETGLTYLDACVGAGTHYYMVRATGLQQGPSGSYYNLSQGVFGNATSTANYGVVIDNLAPDSLLCKSTGSISASFTSTGSFCSGNVFMLEISDSTGNFSAPEMLASQSQSGTGPGSVSGTIPPLAAPRGDGYLVRIRSTLPEVVSAPWPVAFTLDSVPEAQFSYAVFGDSVQCTNLTLGYNLNYLWDFRDGFTSTVRSPGHVYDSTSTFNILLTVQNGCGTDSRALDVAVVGMEEEIPAISLTTYPNPVTETLHIAYEQGGNGPAHFQLVNLRGKIIAKKWGPAQAGAHHIRWSPGEFPNGIYLLQYSVGEESGAVKLHFQR